MINVPKRTTCHWTAPNGLPRSKWSAADTLHSVAGSFSQPYEDWLVDICATADEKPARDYHLARVGDIGVLRDLLDQAEREAVAEARKARASWDEIGKRLGVTRQAAQQRFGEHVQRVIEGSSYYQSRAAK